MPAIHFFLAPEDAIELVTAIESHGPLQYVRTGNATTPDFERFSSGLHIPNLGHATRDSAVACPAFLVALPHAELHVRTLRGATGIPRYCMDQLTNPDTLTWTPAGIWTDQVLIQGTVGTASRSYRSTQLLKRFQLALRKTTRRIQSCHVGTQAFRLLQRQVRLTAAVQCPPEFDLACPAPDP
jgi:hypothetical protein